MVRRWAAGLPSLTPDTCRGCRSQRIGTWYHWAGPDATACAAPSPARTRVPRLAGSTQDPTRWRCCARRPSRRPSPSGIRSCPVTGHIAELAAGRKSSNDMPRSGNPTGTLTHRSSAPRLLACSRHPRPRSMGAAAFHRHGVVSVYDIGPSIGSSASQGHVARSRAATGVGRCVPVHITIVQRRAKGWRSTACFSCRVSGS